MKCFKNYTPITAMPYRHSDSYVEIEPCAALKPYIRCFWGSRDIYTLEAGVSTDAGHLYGCYIYGQLYG